MSETLYSVRMRASLRGLHISGAERVVAQSELERVGAELLSRAYSHERGRPDSVTVTADSLAGKQVVTLPPLPVISREFGTVIEARDAAVSELADAGVSGEAARKAIDLITTGASPERTNMRGAMILDSRTGERLEPDSHSGIRARAVDYHEDFLPELTAALAMRGLDRTHLSDALALATKVAGAPNAVAELCISDDPSYVTGYVASPVNGYVRITPLKEVGDQFGGRAFFVDTKKFDMESYISYMRETPVLLKGAIEFS